MKAIKDIALIVMMYIGIIVIVLTLTRCGSGNVKTEPTEYKIGGHTLTEMTVDGCQYLSSYGTNGMIFVHKGNCTNHRSK
jgi:hypothetical protein